MQENTPPPQPQRLDIKPGEDPTVPDQRARHEESLRRANEHVRAVQAGEKTGIVLEESAPLTPEKEAEVLDATTIMMMSGIKAGIRRNFGTELEAKGLDLDDTTRFPDIKSLTQLKKELEDQT